MKTTPKRRHRSLQYECLEPRQVMAAGITASLQATGVLNVVGTADADQFLLQQIGKLISINGVDGSWSAKSVKSIVIDLQAGDDFVSVNSLANGGTKALKEKVTVISGSGNDLVRLSTGDEVTFRAVGQQLFLAPGAAPQLNGATLNLSSSVVATLKSGVLTVTGTNSNDNILFKQLAGKIYVSGVGQTWSATKVKVIVVNLQDGNDHVSVDSFANGGNQHLTVSVTVKSGFGTSTVDVSSGHAVTLDGIGHTLVVRPDGTATLDGVAVNWDNSPTPARLSGVAWEDHNGNGVRDTGDQGCAGWHILVNGVDRATTDANGNWSVANLAAGTYTVQQVAQTGWNVTSGGAGYSVNAASGSDLANLGFGEFKLISLSGVAWEDHNGNGVRDTGDQGCAGWHILVNGVDRATTDANGNWSVANLAAGTYTVQQVAQTGWNVTSGGAGYTVNAASGTNLGSLGFGEFKLISVSGVAWEDHNGNGVRDTGDQGCAGWHILVNGVDRATTDANGNWSVANLAAGTYTVQQVAQTGWNVTSGGAGYSVNAASGSDLANLGFGEFKLISLSGVAWEDHNGNGVRDTGDQGCAGWHILVNGVDRATTDANGNWSVANLAAGTYTVQQVAQTGWNVTSGGAGYTVNAASGTNLGSLSFGEFNISSPSGNWFDANVLDVALRSLGSSLYVDGLIDRSDIMALFQNAQDGGSVDATEFSDLQAIANNTTLFGTSESVWKLTSYIVSGNTANAKYQGQTLGNLAAGSTATQLGNLVNKWFLGLDRPTTPYGYALASGTLFVNGPSYADIDQGGLNDCGFLSSLAETALRSPSTINNMFVINGDGTYAVRFYHDGVAEYVTVDSYLPAGGGVYAGLPNGELWVALAEKAYAQIGEMSWFGGRVNAYTSIEFLYAFNTLKHVTGQATTGFNGLSNPTGFAADWNAGKLLCLVSSVSPSTGGIVANHVYTVVGYDAATQTITLFNPWGSSYGLTTLAWSQLQGNFSYYDRTA